MTEQHIKLFENREYREQKDVLNELLEALTDLRKSFNAGSLNQRNYPTKKIDELYTRIATKVLSILSAELDGISRETMQKICEIKPSLSYIFFASGYRSTDVLLDTLSNSIEGGGVTIKKNRLLLYLGLVSINDLSDKFLNIALKQPPTILFYLMMGWLAERAVLSDQGEKNRNKLLAHGHLLDGFELLPRDLTLLHRVWMYCSYATSSWKHDIKIHLNKLVRSYLLKGGISDQKNFGIRKGKRKKICIIVERFKKNHAMYRCYAPAIRSLKDKFEVIGVGEASEFDEISRLQFDKTLEYNYSKQSISVMIDEIKALSPDVIYYTSVGMSTRVIMLANLRLAPIQVATLGHPATINSGMIDSIYLGNSKPETDACFSESVYIDPNPIMPIEEHPKLQEALIAEPRLKMPPGINIAVNSKVMKINSSFLKICKRLRNESNKPLNFHFFPGEFGINHDGFSSFIRNYLDNVHVHGYLDYANMMTILRNCRLSLVPFPFGNANGAVDAALFSVPSVFLTGNELHAQTDELMLKILGVPLWGLANSEDIYFSKAKALIEDDKLHKELSDQVSAAASEYFLNKSDRFDGFVHWINRVVS